MTIRFTIFAIAVVALAIADTAQGRCYDLTKSQPRTLTGKLQYAMFPGPPNYEDVQHGDTPEPAYVLTVASPICIMGDDFADPSKFFRDIQVVETKTLSGTLKRYLNRQVTVTLIDQMAAETGHHHEPLVAWVTAISLAGKPMEFTDEYGTPATTIRAFYAALADGQGDSASQLIVPEKRATGPFSAAQLSQFYGKLRRPIDLIDISQTSETEYLVHYRYTAVAQQCNGRAVVKTVTRAGRYYVQAIRALDGC